MLAANLAGLDSSLSKDWRSLVTPLFASPETSPGTISGLLPSTRRLVAVTIHIVMTDNRSKFDLGWAPEGRSDRHA